MFLELTFDNGTKGLFNKNFIRFVEVAHDTKSRIEMSDGEYYIVQESYDVVKNLLRGTVKIGIGTVVADGTEYVVPLERCNK